MSSLQEIIGKISPGWFRKRLRNPLLWKSCAAHTQHEGETLHDFTIYATNPGTSFIVSEAGGTPLTAGTVPNGLPVKGERSGRGTVQAA